MNSSGMKLPLPPRVHGIPYCQLIHFLNIIVLFVFAFCLDSLFTSGFAQLRSQRSLGAEQNAPLINDECETAIIVEALPFQDDQNTRDATNNPADPRLSCNFDGNRTDGNTVWYTFTTTDNLNVEVSTQGSTYNTVIGVFTGACGNLTEVKCSDIGIADFLVFQALAGVTYFIKIGEFKDGAGGGDLMFAMKEANIFQGPALGSIAAGESVSTDDFSLNSATVESNETNKDRLQKVIPLRSIKRRKYIKKSIIEPTGPVGSNFVEDLDASTGRNNLDTRPFEINAPVLEQGFAGIPDLGTVIPPDPIMAAGPNHLIGLVNSQVGIFDKTGTLLKLVDTNDWFANVLPGAFPCDPQIVYDHHADRWIMVWIECGDAAFSLLLSVSDDDNPLGTWCNWRLPGDQNGSTVTGFFNDFPKLGVDENAIYVTANMFGTAFEYVQIRIIPKAQLLDGSCGPVTWTDFWDLRNPSALSLQTFTMVPAVTFGTPGVEYFVDMDVNAELGSTGTFLNLWSLKDPLSNTPILEAVTVPVTAFNAPPDADQLGGSTVLIDVGGPRNRNVVYKDGSVWTAHSVGDATRQFATLRYVRIDVASATAIEDVAFGKDNFWYYYPAVMVDSNNNLFIGFTRSGLTEFASGRYTGRLVTDAPGLQASALLKAGEANYVRGSPNRWGDYLGIALDPVDNSKVWMFLEYATSVGPGANDGRWGTWFGTASFTPLSGPQVEFDPSAIDFGAVLVGNTSLPVPVTIHNFGDQTLTISDISLGEPSSPFILNGLPDFPVLLASFGSVEFNVMFAPTTEQSFADVITISSNDPDDPSVTINVQGTTPANLDLSTTTLDVTLESGQSGSEMFTVGNTGGTELIFEIGFTGIGTLTPSSTAVLPVSLSVHQDGSGIMPFSNLTATKNQISKPTSDYLTPVSKEVVHESLDASQEDELDPEFRSPTERGLKPSQAAAPNTLFQYDVSTQAGEVLALGVEFDGTFFWVSGAGATRLADPNRLFKYDINGNLLQTFVQGTTSPAGWLDLAFDGTFLYGIDRDAQRIDQVDPNTGLTTGVTIRSPLPGARALAYDPHTDHFWISGLGVEILEIDRAGTTINSFQNSLGISGLAWDDSRTSGPFLWVWSREGNGTLASLFDPIAGVYTDVSFDGALLPGPNVAGGAAFTTDLPTDPEGAGVLVGLHQDIADAIIGYLTPPPWITGANPNMGMVASGGSQLIEVNFDALSLLPGNLTGGVVVGSNDPDQERAVIQVNLTVTPATGKQIRVEPDSIDFGIVEVGQSSATATVKIFSVGSEVLTVSEISISGSIFVLGGLPTLPASLAQGNTVEFTVAFLPTSSGPLTATITVASDDLEAPIIEVALSGIGFQATKATPGLLYASTGTADGGRLLTIDLNTGTGTAIGPSGSPRVQGLAINSKGEIFGSLGIGNEPGTGSQLIKIDAATGFATIIGVMRPDFVEALAFDANDVLYGVDSFPGDTLYIIDTNTADVTPIGSTGIALAGLTFAPNGTLFGSTGGGNDLIYTVNINTGTATFVGSTGMQASIPDIAFDDAGNFFGVTGSQGPNPTSLISIDPANAAATVIGPVGLESVSGLAFAPSIIDAVEEGPTSTDVPKAFVLGQNYPNPFNPETNIRYQIPKNSHVTLKVFNLLGQTVRTLVDAQQAANSYEVAWDGKNGEGVPQPSGIYIFQLKAGKNVQTRKMLFIK